MFFLFSVPCLKDNFANRVRTACSTPGNTEVFPLKPGNKKAHASADIMLKTGDILVSYDSFMPEMSLHWSLVIYDSFFKFAFK